MEIFREREVVFGGAPLLFLTNNRCICWNEISVLRALMNATLIPANERATSVYALRVRGLEKILEMYRVRDNVCS